MSFAQLSPSLLWSNFCCLINFNLGTYYPNQPRYILWNKFFFHILSILTELLLLEWLYFKDLLFQSSKISTLKQILSLSFIYFDQAFVAWFTLLRAYYSNQSRYLIWNFLCSEIVYFDTAFVCVIITKHLDFDENLMC